MHEHAQPQHASTPTLHLIKPGDARRAALRNHLNEVYGDAFGAEPGHLHDHLLAVHDAAGQARGLIGASRACDHTQLFAERYLDEPAEQLWSRRLGRELPRSALVEVGNLAARHPGLGPLLITALAHHLDAVGTPYVLFAGTDTLRASFRHMGVRLDDHGRADPARLGAEASVWGSYYAHDPRLCSVDVRDVISANQERLSRSPQRAALLNAARQLAPWKRSA